MNEEEFPEAVYELAAKFWINGFCQSLAWSAFCRSDCEGLEVMYTAPEFRK